MQLHTLRLLLEIMGMKEIVYLERNKSCFPVLCNNNVLSFVQENNIQ